jgi:hypothetical protein
VNESPTKGSLFTLLEVLENPHFLSAFAKYLDKEGRVGNLQFWMSVSAIQELVQSSKAHNGEEWIDKSDEFIVEEGQRIFDSFFVKEEGFVDIEADAFKELKNCFDKLKSKDPSEISSLRWYKLLLKAKDFAMSQMESDYPQFTQSSYYSKAISQLSPNRPRSEASDMYDDATPRGSTDSTFSRGDFDDERARKSGFKVPNMFKMLKKEDQSLQIPDELRTPARKDGSENVEGELKSILLADDKTFGRSFFGKKQKSYTTKSERRGESDDASSDNERPGFFRSLGRKRSPSHKPSGSKSLRDTSPLAKGSSPMSEDSEFQSDDGGLRASEDSLLSSPKLSSDHSPGSRILTQIPENTLILVPSGGITEAKKRFEQLDQEYKQVQLQMDSVPQNDEAEKQKWRQLSLMKVGLEVELTAMRAKIGKLELEEMENFLSPVSCSYNVAIGSVSYLTIRFNQDRITVTLLEARTVGGTDSKGFTVYPIEVKRSNPEGPPSKWIIYRRYSEFESLNNKLKSMFPFMSNIEFPSKNIKDLIQNRKLLVEARRKALEKYLQVVLHYFEILVLF